MNFKVRKIGYIISAVFLFLTACSFDGDSNSTTSSTSNTSVIELKSPANESKAIYVSGANLQWSTTAPAGTLFEVFLESTSGKGILPTTSSWNTTPKGLGITSTTYYTGQLSYLTWYAWRVRAIYSSGSWIDSPVNYFQTEDIPASATNIIKIHDYETHINIDHNIPILFQVLDPSGNGITGLTINDFEVMEDGEPMRETDLTLTPQAASKVFMPVHILIDNSTSITDNSILTRMKSDATTAVSTLGSSATFTPSFYVYEFSENLIPKGGNVPTPLTSAVAMNEINNIGSGVKSTDFYGAVADVANTMTNIFTVSKITQEVMVVLSDGDDTAAKRTLAEATNAVSGKRVYTIGYSGDLREEILKMVGVSGYYNSSNGNVSPFLSNIRTYLSDFSQSFYLLTVTSPKRGFRSHTITLRMRGSLDSVNLTYPGW